MAEGDRSHAYRTSCALFTGRSHASSGMPCQDYVAARSQNGFACVALADGAGSKKHSEHGSRTVVKAVTRLLLDRFDELWTMAETNPSQTTNEILQHCLQALERQAIGLRCDMAELASTLLFVAHSKGRYLAGHLGDGCILHQQEDGQIMVLSHPENGEFANTTFFVTDSTAPSRLRLYRGQCGQGAGFVLLSDGTAESLYRRLDKTPATAAVRQILSWSRTKEPAQMREVLSDNLEHAFARKTTDDCSIGVLSM